jgi:hypothetical protein
LGGAKRGKKGVRKNGTELSRLAVFATMLGSGELVPWYRQILENSRRQVSFPKRPSCQKLFSCEMVAMEQFSSVTLLHSPTAGGATRRRFPTRARRGPGELRALRDLQKDLIGTNGTPHPYRSLLPSAGMSTPPRKDPTRMGRE